MALKKKIHILIIIHFISFDDNHLISLNKSTAEAAHSFSILELSADLFYTNTVSWR